MIVVHAHSFASAIRWLFKEPFMLLALVGPSTIGKSITQKSAQSKIGPTDEPDGVRTMTGTAIGITEEILKHNHISVFFQDTRQIKDRQILIDLIFSIADGASYMKSGAKRKNNSATVFLSNERFLADMATVKNSAIDEGVYARLFEIYCDAPYGVFHELHGFKDGKKFADMIENNCEVNYGAIWPSWIKVLSENWLEVVTLHDKWLPKVKAKIAKTAGSASLGRVNDRVLDSLSFSAWAGLIASHFNIFPIGKDEIVEAFGLVMKKYVSRQAT